MSASTRIGIYALCGIGILALIALATTLGSAIPLFFTWIPAALMMLIEDRTSAIT